MVIISFPYYSKKNKQDWIKVMFPSYYPVSNNGKYANNMFETQYTHTIKLLPLMLYVVTESMACGECQFKNTQS